MADDRLPEARELRAFSKQFGEELARDLAQLRMVRQPLQAPPPNPGVPSRRPRYRGKHRG